jgi:hypothetical protein
MMAAATLHRAAALKLHWGATSGEVSNWADLPQVFEMVMAGLAPRPPVLD